MDELKRYLIHLPQSLGFREDRKIKVNLYKALYYAITGDGKYLDLLFSGIPQEEIVALEGYLWPQKLNRTRPFYNYVASAKYTHPQGQTCGRILEENEPVYRCADCGYDDTCVICVHCFNREDHIDHNVSVYISRGDSGGMCDCGDETAFLRKLNCACQNTNEDLQELSLEFKDLMRKTLTVVLNYILDVTNFSINTLPLIHKNINNRGDLKITSKQISDFSSLPSDVYGAKDENSDDIWYLVLWNDENHDYLEAETGIRAATGVTDERAKEIANEINTNGRAVLKVAKVYTDLLKGQKLAEADGLVATIMTARDYMREVIVLNMFNWLADITSFPGNSSFREESKSLLAELLLEPNFEFSKIFPAEFFQTNNLDIKREFFRNGLLYNGEILNLALTKLKPGVSTSSLMKSCHDLFRPAFEDNIARSRIQYLLTFEIRFVSLIRKKFNKAILPIFFTDPITKATFCEQYTDIFPIALTILALSDREEQLASATDVSIQLFTCPRSNKWIVSSGKLGNILGPLSTLIEDYSSRVNSSGYPNLIDIIVDIRSKREKSSIQKTITDTVDSLNRIISKNDDENILNLFLTHDNLVLFLNFQKYFQGSSPIKRKYGDHVERELLEDFYTFLQRSLPVLSIVQNVSKVKDLNAIQAVKAVGLILEFLSLRKLRCSAPGIAEFRVSKESVSYINPLNSFLSYILQKCGFDAVKDVFNKTKVPFMYVSDFSLRSIVLASQVKIGFWIRNGVTVSRQASYYTDTMADISYYRDFFLNQVASIVDNPLVTLLNFLDRWELLQWYAGDVHDNKTVYEERFSFICEQFVLFIYNLITDRFYFDNDLSKEGTIYRVKKAICYALCEEPKSYTSLKVELGRTATILPEFDDLLYECADYNGPTGLYDFGVYRLKPHLYEKLDPLSLHLDSSSYLSVSESLIMNIAKNKKIDERLVVLTPEFYLCKSSYVNEKIGEITRTKEFAKLVYKLLQVALNLQDELFLPHLLHLIHAVIIDDEMVNGPGHLADYFVSIPISDLLLSIAESTMSTHIVLKADYLLDQFVKRDTRIMDSLVDCFGEEHVQSYKKRKIGLFETEAEKWKRMAEDRKAKVMRKFAKQRQKFMQQNDVQDVEADVAVDEPETNLRKCVACGESESLNQLFGLLLCRTKSSIFWKVPHHGTQYLLLAFSDLDARAQPDVGKIYPPGYPYQHMMKDKNSKITATVASSCAHGMHYKCYMRAKTQFKSFPCPLCHNLHDSFIPSFMLDKNIPVNQEYLRSEPQVTKYNRIIASYGGDKNDQLSKALINQGHLTSEDFEHEFVELNFKSDLDSQSASEKFLELTILIADTIRANEIASRLEGTKSLSNFVEAFPTASKALLRSMMQTRIYLHRCGAKLLGENLETVMADLVKRTWDPSRSLDGLFNEVVVLFFQTNESLRTCIRLGFVKLVAVTAFSLCHNFTNVLNGTLLNCHHLDESLIRNLNRFVDQFIYNDEDSQPRTYSPNFFGNLFYAIERISLPFLRQCVIFYDLLTCETIGQNEFRSLDSFVHLKSAIESQIYKDSSDELCKFLDIPTLSCLFLGVALKDNFFDFEVGILDVHFNAKIPSQMEHGVLNLQYPGVIRLIDLPDDYSDCITDPQYKTTTGVDSICLQCGTYLDSISHVTHISKCSFMPIYFSPGSNTLNVVIHIADNPFEFKIPAPYLTIHGEVKRDRLPGKASLNHYRYEYLNKLWLSQGLFGFITRTLFGMRENRGPVPVPTEIGQEVDFGDESDDDFGMWE